MKVIMNEMTVCDAQNQTDQVEKRNKYFNKYKLDQVFIFIERKSEHYLGLGDNIGAWPALEWGLVFPLLLDLLSLLEPSTLCAHGPSSQK